MKKLSFVLFALLAVTLFTACGNNDESVNKVSYSMLVNSRAIDGDKVLFSQNNGAIELDYTAMTIKLSINYKDPVGILQTLSTTTMPLTAQTSDIYTFKSIGDEGLIGIIDLSRTTMWYTFTNGTQTIVCTTQMWFANVTTAVTNPDNGAHYEQAKSEYMIAIDSNGTTCKLGISNFAPNVNGQIEENSVIYNDLKVTPTTTGYHVTAQEVKPTTNIDRHTITDLNIFINNQCRSIEGTFKCNGLNFNVSGSLFANGANPNNL